MDELLLWLLVVLLNALCFFIGYYVGRSRGSWEQARHNREAAFLARYLHEVGARPTNDPHNNSPEGLRRWARDQVTSSRDLGI